VKTIAGLGSIGRHWRPAGIGNQIKATAAAPGQALQLIAPLAGSAAVFFSR